MIKEHFEPIIITIEEEYEIPHLNATRKISALLPYDYHESDRHYPVLYLQDGQNLFNPHAPFGDWAIDQSLGQLAAQGMKDVIIIAIDHGETERIKEYLPYYHPRFGEGKGQFYIEFMKEKLIPYVNKNYRTKTDHKNTGIGGSSMGGLISLYAGLTQPDVFGRLMIFSPSLWMSKIIFNQARMYHPHDDSRIYIYAGGKESENHLRNVKKLDTILRTRRDEGLDLDINLVINYLGEHREIYWKEEFPKALKWLFFKNHE